MPQLKENAFTFVSQALPEETFTVVRFSGEEGLSTLYSFEILMISEKEDIDLTTVLQKPATFTIKGSFSGGEDLPFHGILSAFEQMHQADTYFFYRAELRPRLWWLTLTHHNQVFLDKRVDQFLGEVLKDGGLAPGLDFALQFQGKYQPWEYVCQYGESHFGFVSRWMEREGVYYWFEQGKQSEKMIASDTLIAHAPLPGHETFLYSPPSGLDATGVGKVIKRFTLKQSPLPKNVLLKDYNYMKPRLDLEGKAAIQDKGRGEIYLYGENFPSKSEGDRLARMRAEEFRCREKIFHGLSSIPALRPGYTFQMQRHYRGEFNQSYLTTHVRHEGSQERYLLSGLGLTDLDAKDELFYRNTFQCIPAATQFRPPRTTPKPRMAGALTARIDAAGSGKYAELDEYGRYKVVLPFDLSGRHDGKASCWLRMIQPYSGPDHGLHFPLHKGCEVMLHFIDGDPNRPIIAGAAPNPENPSQVNDASESTCKLTTAGGNKMHIEDQEGSQHIHLASPTADSHLILGAIPAGASGGDHGQAERDHQQAAGDHAQAGTDHGTASSDHSQAEDDHQQVEQDHEQVAENREKINELEEKMQENKKEGQAGKLWGVSISTSKWLKVEAEVSNKAILGNDFTFIGGGEEKIVAGISADAHLISKFGFTAAVQGEWAPQRLNMHLTHSKLETEVNQLSGSVNTLQGNQATIVGELTNLRGDHNNLSGSVNTLRGDHNRLDGTVNTLSGDLNRLDGTVNTLRGDHNQLEGTVNTLRGDHNALAGSVNQLSSENNTIAAVIILM